MISICKILKWCTLSTNWYHLTPFLPTEKPPLPRGPTGIVVALGRCDSGCDYIGLGELKKCIEILLQRYRAF